MCYQNHSESEDGAVAANESPHRASIQVRPGRIGDVTSLARLLVRAFSRDPQFTWIFGDPGAHEDQFALFFTMYLHDALSFGHLEVAADESRSRLVGGALWMPPGRRFPPLRRQIAAIPTYRRVFEGRLRTASQLANSLAKAHPKEPHWYLTVLGVEPNVQGSGVGGALLRSGLSRADAEGRPVYLETNTSQNVALYSHVGFSVRSVVEFPNGCPASTTMWRPPAGTQKERRDVAAP